MLGLAAQEFLVVFFLIIPAIIGYKLAQMKGRSAGFWAVISFIFPIAILILLFLPKQDHI